MARRPAVSYDTVRRIGLALPDAEDSTSYGTPALKVKGQLFARLREDGDSLVLKTTFEQRDALMAEDPETYYMTDHYRDYTWVLVRLSKVTPDALNDLVQGAYRLAVQARTSRTRRRPIVRRTKKSS
jgi:hypothetical protein